MEIPRHWRLKKQRYGLVGSLCPEGHVDFPPVKVCKKCEDISEDKKKNTTVYDSSLLFSPNNKVIHSEVVR